MADKEWLVTLTVCPPSGYCGPDWPMESIGGRSWQGVVRADTAVLAIAKETELFFARASGWMIIGAEAIERVQYEDPHPTEKGNGDG